MHYAIDCITQDERHSTNKSSAAVKLAELLTLFLYHDRFAF
ncbi:hypothetical protein BLGI_4610 [Brevibacillus laterosporus GI-9]|nr:hypothetical protein BLGI_4610 [Brevibacillus laterosporus GI-9]